MRVKKRYLNDKLHTFRIVAENGEYMDTQEFLDSFMLYELKDLKRIIDEELMERTRYD